MILVMVTATVVRKMGMVEGRAHTRYPSLLYVMNYIYLHHVILDSHVQQLY